MRTFLKSASVLAALTLVSACSTTTQIASDVARFHRLPVPAGETFRIVPSDASKKGSLEFDSYATQVTSQLVQAGFRPADASVAATYDVRLDYMISGGKEKIASRPGFGSSFSSSRYYGGFGGYGGYGGFGGYGRHGFRGGYSYYDPFYDPFFYGGGFSEPEVYSYTVYTRKLNLDIVKTVGGDKLFEGRVESTGSDNRLPEVMPYLVQAMFTNFPGNSGVTQRVKIDVKRN
jgi:Domain of unknown function (DUF4136)